MRVKGITGEFEEGYMYMYDYEYDTQAGAIFTAKELESPVVELLDATKALTSVVTSNIGILRDAMVAGTLYVREDHPVFNIDLLPDAEFETSDSEHPTANDLAKSVWLSVREYIS